MVQSTLRLPSVGGGGEDAGRGQEGKNEEQEQNPIRKYAAGSLFTDKQAVLEPGLWQKHDTAVHERVVWVGAEGGKEGQGWGGWG